MRKGLNNLDFYNKTRNPIDLYTLTCYSFNYQFRFNNNLEYNNPFGRNRSQFSDNMEHNLIVFISKLKKLNIEFSSKDFTQIPLDGLTPDDLIYCDPPYLITTGTYNDGNRGFKDWKAEQEYALYDYLDDANKRGIKFALSNVIEHKGRVNDILLNWAKKYRVIDLNYDFCNAYIIIQIFVHLAGYKTQVIYAAFVMLLLYLIKIRKNTKS